MGASLGHDDGLSVTLREVNVLYLLQTQSAQGSVRALAAHGGEEDEEKAASKEAALWHFCQAHLGADAVCRLSMEDDSISRLPFVPG